METIEGFDFFPLETDDDGKVVHPRQLTDLTQHISQVQASDVVFLGHGFRNDQGDARGVYSGFLQTFRAHLGRPELSAVQARRFVVCGIFWPSKTFRESFGEGAVQAVDDLAAEKRDVKHRLQMLRAEESRPAQQVSLDRAIGLLDLVEDSTSMQDQFVDALLSILDDTALDPTEGLDKIRAQDGSHLLANLEEPLLLPTAEAPRDEGGVMTVDTGGGSRGDGQVAGIQSFFGSIFGRIGQLLNLTTWYLMKDRCGKVGANGAADAVRAVQQAGPVKIHLVGHSLGGRLMASCAKTVAERGNKVDSLTLLQAAFSHYGLSSTRDGNQPGFFKSIIDRKAVTGPLISTYSSLDTVVGKAYAIASRLANDNTRAVGDENDEFGGIGRNGAQNAQNSVVEALHLAGQPYGFSAGQIVNLNGSDNLITNHGDVENPNVTYAFAWAVQGT